ncbi:MAG: carbohydrate kinase family protein [Bariatricus sp.]|nr:carbohydrate kinase family protein [Bariatricus sp.]
MERIDKERIVIIGASILDVLVRPADRNVFETGSSPAEDISISFGGDALNEATVLAALGKKVQLQTLLGNDTEAKMIRDHCEKSGIELSTGKRNEEIKTGVNVVLIKENGERSFLTNKNGSLRKLKAEDIELPFPQDTGILCFASIFVFPEIRNQELAKLFRAAKAQGITICADMTKRKQGESVEGMKESLAYIDFLIPNEEEACLLTGKESAELAANSLIEAGTGCVIIKCGSKGCYIRNREIAEYVPAVLVEKCVDTTGAGDSFAAGFIYGLSEGWELKKCARYANSCGAKAVQVMGATNWCNYL